MSYEIISITPNAYVILNCYVVLMLACRYWLVIKIPVKSDHTQLCIPCQGVRFERKLKDLVEYLPSNYGMLDRKGKDDVRANLLGVTGMYEFDVLINK